MGSMRIISRQKSKEREDSPGEDFGKTGLSDEIVVLFVNTIRLVSLLCFPVTVSFANGSLSKFSRDGLHRFKKVFLGGICDFVFGRAGVLQISGLLSFREAKQ